MSTKFGIFLLLNFYCIGSTAQYNVEIEHEIKEFVNLKDLTSTKISNDSIKKFIKSHYRYHHNIPRNSLRDSLYEKLVIELSNRKLLDDGFKVSSDYLNHQYYGTDESKKAYAYYSVCTFINKDQKLENKQLLHTYLDSTLTIAKRIKSFVWEGQVYSMRADILMDSLLYEESIKLFIKADSCLSMTNDKDAQGQLTFNLARVYYIQNDFKNALKYFKKSEKLLIKGTYEQVFASQAIGIALINMDSFDLAEKYLLKIDPFLVKSSSERLTNLASIQFIQYQQKRFKSSYETFEIIDSIYREYPNLVENKSHAYDIGILTLFELFELKKASNYLSLYKEWFPTNEISILGMEVGLDLLRYNGHDARDRFVRYSNIQDSIFINDIANESLALSEKYQTEKIEIERDQLKIASELKDLKNNRQMDIIIFTCLIIGIVSGISIWLYKINQSRKTVNRRLSKQKEQIEILNKEINHRVKNNLAFVTSLLEMQGRRSNTSETKEILKESENRLKALSLIHHNLFRNSDTSTIDLSAYLNETIGHLQNIFEIPDKVIQFNTSFANISIDAEDAMRIGLIINELVTNSVKHAFAKIDKPEIKIETVVEENGKISINYADNGFRMHVEKYKTPKQSESMGKKLISMLEKQLEESVIIKIA